MKFFQKHSITALAALALISLTPLAAQAHDEVVGTSPAADSTVSTGPVTVSVSFNEDIMKNPDLSGEVIQLVDSQNNSWTLDAGCLSVEGATLSTKVDIERAGEYTVNWRSVSNDGHPNEGAFKFTVEAKGQVDPNAPAVAPLGEGACPVTYSGIDSAIPVETATPMTVVMPAPMPSASAQPDPFIQNLPFLGAGIVLIVLGAIAGPLLQRLRTKRAAERAALKKLEEEED